MHTDITYEKALERHPQVVKSMMQSAKLKNPKWKHKILPNDKATHWYYDSCISVSFNPDQNGIIMTHLVVQQRDHRGHPGLLVPALLQQRPKLDLDPVNML